jgi:hypothetical protein
LSGGKLGVRSLQLMKASSSMEGDAFKYKEEGGKKKKKKP